MRAAVLCCAVFLPCAVWAAGPFDGVYRGTYYPAGNGNARCPDGREFSVTITDNKFTYGGAGDGERVTATVGPDGRFSAQSGQRFLQGTIRNGQLDASTSGSRCNYVWSLKK